MHPVSTHAQSIRHGTHGDAAAEHRIMVCSPACHAAHFLAGAMWGKETKKPASSPHPRAPATSSCAWLSSAGQIGWGLVSHCWTAGALEKM